MHFDSKLDAFVHSLRYGLAELRQAMFDLRKKRGDRWLAAFVDYYLGFKRTCLLADGCSLPALTPEVERAGPEAQAAYRDELEQLIALFLADLPRASRRSARRRAIATLALLSGGLSMARAVHDPRLSREIARSVREAVLSQGSA